MAIRERVVHKNHNPTLYITELSPINHCFHNGYLSTHIFESTKGIEIKLVTYIDVNERKYRRQEPETHLIFY